MKVLVAPLCSTTVSSEELLRCIRSVEGQVYHPFEWDLAVICNTNDDEYYREILAAVPDEYPVIQTESNGGNGLGHNSVLRYFLEVCEANEYTHLIMIDADDFYYPVAFQSIGDIADIVPFDYLSNGQITDSVRCHETQQPHREISPGIWLHSNFNRRHAIQPHGYWDGTPRCGGGEVTLCVSRKAVEYGLWHWENPMTPDDVSHMLYGLKGFVEGKLLFVNTDCNDVYVYDKTNPVGTTNQAEFVFDPKLWPAEQLEHFTGPTFECLRGLTKADIPFVTIPQEMFAEDKIEFIQKNLIKK